LKQHIGTSLPDSADNEALKLEVEQLKEKNKELEDEVTSLKEKVRMNTWFFNLFKSLPSFFCGL